MKRVLFVTTSCFPVRGAECIVNARLLSVLSESGQFKIDLVTKKSKWQNYPSDSLQEYGIRLESLEMIEVDNRINLRTLWQHFLSLLTFGTVNKGDHWAVKALPIVKRKIRQNKYDYILTRAQPSHLIGNYIKEKFDVKWVCTWNDPYPTDMYPKPFGKGNDISVVRSHSKAIKIMRNADVFIYPNRRLANYMNSFINSPNERIMIIPHVMMDIPKQVVKRKGSRLRLIHSGNCTGTRSASLFLLALQEIINCGVIRKEDILVSFLGLINDDEQQLIKDSILKDVVELLEPVSYLNSLEILNEYDVAIIIEAPWEEGVFLPTKVSDFMMAGKRIFTISPREGMLHDLYKQGYISYYADVTDISSIKNELMNIIEDNKKDEWSDFTVKVPIEYTKSYVLSEFLSIK